ncbi:MAG: NAD(P)/FAD-dependent oxidoreductase [Acidobacteria bacterium]|nr:NAD(P)/FAD-dependent oxidoreductase [Acidobacteriota bacterium]
MTFDVAILGAGPAGLAAARAAARSGKSIVLIDDNFAPGGQIWRGASQIELPSGVRFYPQTRLFAVDPGFTLHTEPLGTIHTTTLILATGARELFLPFPGWTLPGVFGAGGLQALVKAGADIKGKRVLVAGSGPLLLAVAATLRKRGARIAGIAEQANFGTVVSFLKKYPAKLPQAIALRARLIGVPYMTGVWPTRFEPRQVTLSTGRTLKIDYLACGFGLVPNTEVAQHLGCRLDDGFVAVDSRQRTTVDNVYCAGEPTGIGGLDKALEEGERAGAAATGQPVSRKRSHTGAFVRDLAATFALHHQLYSLAGPETILCRCEQVTHATLAPYREWRDAKLQTRCGMGACQGRICGPIVHHLFGWTATSIRPPLVPVPAASLLTTETPPEPENDRSDNAHPSNP